MSKLAYSFHPIADQQQDDIWFYIYQNWGVAQADSYIDGLHEKLLQVFENLSLLRDVPESIISGVSFFHYIRHYIFVRARKDASHKVQVLSILHDSMDVPAKLRELLGEVL